MPLYEKKETPPTGEEEVFFVSSYQYPFIAVLSLLLLAIGFLFAHFLKQRSGKGSAPQESPPGEEARPDFVLDEDGKRLVAILEANEGRMLQRELREHLKFSETKMSLLLDELEFNKIVKRIKKGRGNIIKLLKRGENG